jgi:hypothetical protein
LHFQLNQYSQAVSGKAHKYISSDENEEKAISLLKKYQQDVKGPAFQVLTAVMFNLERSFFTELSTYLKLSEPEPFQKLRSTSLPLTYKQFRIFLDKLDFSFART